MSTALVETVSKLRNDSAQETESALKSYRSIIRLLRDGVVLKPKQHDELAKAMESLDLSPTDVENDVSALIAYDTYAKAAENGDARQAALMDANKELVTKREQLTAELRKTTETIHLNIQKHEGISSMKIQLRRHMGSNPRLFAASYRPAPKQAAKETATNLPQMAPPDFLDR